MKYLGSSGLTRLVELINERFATKTELNGKANSTHEHSYAGSSMAGGAATSANKINTDAGSATQPVYFDDGVPVATTYALNATVPAGAKFTDTTYENATTSEAGLMSAADKTIVNGIATTYAPLSSPVFTGTPVAPTPTTGDDSTKIATTAFVNDAISNIPSSTEWDDIVNKPSTFEPATHTHNYAASSTAGGSALSAEKINANAGSPSQPIYFNNGIPVATTYALNKTVPADAVFTDTTVGSDITLTGYSKPASTSAIAAADTVNQAIGKLEKALDGKPDTSEFTVLTEAEIYTLFGVSIPKTPFNLANYAANNITDYGNITTLPQENIEELTNIMPESDASSAFYNCKNITSLSGVEQTWDTSNVTNMGVMFNRCLALTSLDVSNWDTSNVTNFNQTFKGCSNLTTLDVSNWNTVNVTDMSGIFNGCSALTSLDVSNWDTSNVTSAKSMFYDCKKLNNVDISSWDLSKVENIDNLFYDCESLTNLDVGLLSRLSHIKYANYLFYNCKSLQWINLKNWHTSNLQEATYLFAGCSDLLVADITNFDTRQMQSALAVWYMFQGCTKIEYIIIDREEFIFGFSKLQKKGSNWNNWDFFRITEFYPRKPKILMPAAMARGLGNTIQWNGYNTNKYFDDIEKYDITYTGNKITDEIIVTPKPTTEFIAVYYAVDNIENYSTITDLPQEVISDLANRVMPYHTSCMFRDSENITSLSNVEETWDMSNVESMKQMFLYCRKLLSLNANSWDVSKVTNMVSMFEQCYNLQSFVVPSWNAKPEYMYWMFHHCHNIVEIDLSNIDFSDVTSLRGVWGDCWKLKTLRLPQHCTMSNVETMIETFASCHELSGLDLSEWDTGKVTSLNCTFSDTNDVNMIRSIESWDVRKVKDMTYMISGVAEAESTLNKLTYVDFTRWNVESVERLFGTFSNLQHIESIDLSTWETPNLTNMSNIFIYDKNLKVIDISNFSLPSDGYASDSFASCDALEFLIIGSEEFKFNMPDSSCGGLNTTCKILVPQALISTYQAAGNWSNHASQFDAIENYTITRSNGQVTVTPKNN